MKDTETGTKKLRILMVSYLYPPLHMGGYELRCSWVASALQKKGHEVCVVASSYKCDSPRRDAENVDGIKVSRVLHDYNHTHAAKTRWQSLLRLRRQYRDVLNFNRIIDDFKPDVICWWYIGGLCKGLLPVPSARGIPDIHFIDDLWMVQLGNDTVGDSFGWDRFWKGQWRPRVLGFIWRRMASIMRWFAERRGVPFRFENITSDYACYVSQFQKQANRSMRIHFKDSRVIYGGAFEDIFFSERDWNEMASNGRPLRLIYAGAITESRRLHDLINALDNMDDVQNRKFTLTIVGKPPNKKLVPYYNRLRDVVSGGKLKDCVNFLGEVPHNEMPETYAGHDVLVFPSTRPEGLPLTMVEAMISGCCVLTTGSGGAAEVAIAGDLPIFAAGSAHYLKKMLLDLEGNRRQISEHARRGQSVAMERFTFSRMLEEIEQVMLSLTGKSTNTNRI